MCITGTSAPKGHGDGKMLVVDRNSFETVYEIKYQNTVRLLQNVS